MTDETSEAVFVETHVLNNTCRFSRYTASRFSIQKWVLCHANPSGWRNKGLNPFGASANDYLESDVALRHAIDVVTDRPTGNASV